MLVASVSMLDVRLAIVSTPFPVPGSLENQIYQGQNSKSLLEVYTADNGKNKLTVPKAFGETIHGQRGAGKKGT